MSSLAYGKGIVAPAGQRLLRQHEVMEKGDTFMADVLDEPIPVEATIGLRVEDTPFIGVFRPVKEAQ
jgi:hypothetical protein